jgi:hypothetical protein
MIADRRKVALDVAKARASGLLDMELNIWRR